METADTYVWRWMTCVHATVVTPTAQRFETLLTQVEARRWREVA
ncbi:hypothetical protein PF003_g33869 [Phytophthora fragariae]|nr:hypothetical protein PF003_g33869 [Phytophthora fragariae]